ncbi:TPA: phage antirepressor N-terminal domain-containing protein [Salmonella enterica]|nr:phage antirepressor N-terminal domain-containing protein [Salmonella enterica]
MTSIAILEAVNTSYVPFNGQQIITAMAAGVAYVAMKPIVENLGMSWTTQYRKLMAAAKKSNHIHMNTVDKDRDAHMSTPSKFGCCDIAIPSKGGIQKMLCIPLKKLNGWLFSINPEKVRADIRDKLIKYQEECFTVLHDYWTKGHVVNPRKAKKALPGKITTEQQEAIKQLVMSRGQSLPKEKQAKAMITMWSSLKSHFGCLYKEISEEQFTEALSLAARVPLEGEFIGKQEELPSKKLNIPDITMEWWYSNNFPMRVGNLERYPGHKVWHDLTLTPPMMYGEDTKSPALFLIEILERMGFDMVAPRIEVETMRIMLGKGKRQIRVVGDGRVKYLLSL